MTLGQGVGAQRVQSPQQANNPPSPNSSVSKPLPVALLKRFKSKSIREISEKSVQMRKSKKILEENVFKPERKSENYENSFQMTLGQGVGAQRVQSPQQASNPPSPNSSVSKPLPVVLLNTFPPRKPEKNIGKKP